MVHDQGLVSVLRQIHHELDAAVLEAYGWQDCGGGHRSPRMNGSSEDDSRRPVIAATLLTRLVALNHARAAEEKRGLIRYLRPDYQIPSSAAPQPIQTTLAGTDLPSSKSKILNLSRRSLAETDQQSSIINLSSPLDWPDRLPDQVAILRKLIGPGDRNVAALDAESLPARFGRKNKNAPTRSRASWRR